MTSTTADLEYARECHVPRIRVKSQEVVNGPGTTSTFLRFPDRFTNSESILTRRKTSSAQLLDLATKVANTDPVQTVRDLASLLDHCTQQGQKIAALRPTKNDYSPVNLGTEARSELG